VLNVGRINEMKGQLLDPKIDPDDLDLYPKNQIVQPLFEEDTKFDVLASIWSSSSAFFNQDQVFWRGALGRNLSYVKGNSQDISMAVELDLHPL